MLNALRFMVFVLCFVPLNASARQNYAMLVGVSEYPSLSVSQQLNGPTNDVLLLQKVLLEKGFKLGNINILTGTVAGAEEPTRENILKSLSDIADKAQKNDFIYLHFSGHGSQQPVSKLTAAGETDGLDEIFLPQNIGKWDNRTGKVKNALTDDEVSAAIKAIRKKQAFVWVVFDSCHSGDMTRSASVMNVTYRKVKPATLGIPQATLKSAQKKYAHTIRGSKKTSAEFLDNDKQPTAKLAGYVAFFASQTNELAPEMALPAGFSGAKPYGLLTYILAEVMSGGQDITYRQAGQQIIQKFAAMNLSRPLPVFEGTGLDARLFGVKNTQRVRQWPIKKQPNSLMIHAGKLHQLGVKSVFAIVKSPTAQSSDAIGYVELESSTMFTSQLKPVVLNKKRPLDINVLPANAYARLINPRVDYALRIASPQARAGYNSAEQAALKMINQLQKIKSENVNLLWDQRLPLADIYLQISDNKIYLIPPAGELQMQNYGKLPSIHLYKAGGIQKSAVELRQQLLTSLKTVSKVTNLLRLSGSTMGSNPNVDIQLQLFVTHAKTGKEKKLTVETLPDIHSGDTVRFNFKNNSSKAVDVTLLFVDSQYGVHGYYPSDGANNRIVPGGELNLSDEISAETVGIERMLVIATQAVAGSASHNFLFLSQLGLPKTLRGKRSGLSVIIDEPFIAAGFGRPQTRGINVKPSTSGTAMRLFSWKSMP